MKKFLLSLISVLALSSAASAALVSIPGSGETWASYTWNSETNSDDKVIKMEAVIGDFTFTYDKGTSSSDIANANPATINQLRIYAGSSITITGTTPFTKITGVVASSSKATDANLSEGWALDGSIITSSGSTFTFVSETPQTSITFSGANNKQFRISSLSIETYEDPIATTVATPEITPATGKYGEAQKVTITCTSEGAAIYYTTDGTAPTNESTLYEAPFTVSETTTVKAIAYVGTDASKVASSTITILDSYNSLADLLANGPQPELGATSEEFIVNFDLIVSYVDGANVIVTDNGTNYTLIYKYDTGLQPGDVVAAGWVATAQNYKTQYELVPAETLTKNGTADVPAFKEINDMSQLTNADIYHIVVVKNVYFADATPETAVNFTATQNGENYTMYNKFKIAGVEAGWYDVTLVVWMYSTLGYYPLAYEIAAPIEVPENLYIMGEAFGSDLSFPNFITMEKEGNKFTYSGVADNSFSNIFTFTTSNESEELANENALGLASGESTVVVGNTYELSQTPDYMEIAEGSYTLTVTYYDYRIELSITNYDSSVLDITNDAAAPVEYFNLQGVRVAEPTTGALYIVRQGSTVTKRTF